MQNVPGSRDKLPSFIFPQEDPSIEEERRRSSKRTGRRALADFSNFAKRKGDDLSLRRGTLDHAYSSFCQII